MGAPHIIGLPFFKVTGHVDQCYDPAMLLSCFMLCKHFDVTTQIASVGQSILV